MYENKNNSAWYLSSTSNVFMMMMKKVTIERKVEEQWKKIEFKKIGPTVRKLKNKLFNGKVNIFPYVLFWKIMYLTQFYFTIKCVLSFDYLFVSGRMLISSVMKRIQTT